MNGSRRLEGNLIEEVNDVLGTYAIVFTRMNNLLEHELGHVRALVRMAGLDGHINDSERRVIRRIAKSRSVNPARVDKMLDAAGADQSMFVPDGLGNRMGLLHDLMLLAYLDGTVDAREKALIERVIRAFSLRPQLTDHLIDLFRYGTPQAAEWNDFVDHVKRSFVER